MARWSQYGLLLALLTGCGGSAPPAKNLPATVPVTGIVKMDGKPLSHTSVTFVPTGNTKGVECVGAADEEGKFSLTQLRGSTGCPPGEYRVILNRYVKPGGQPVALNTGEAPADAGAIESLPPKYSGMESQLVVTVPPSGGEIPIEIKGGK